MTSTAFDKTRNLLTLASVMLPSAMFGSPDSGDLPQQTGLNAVTGPAVTASLKSAVRVDPRTQGVNLTYSPTEFTYVHDYPFQNLGAEAKSVYFLLPRDYQGHAIQSVNYSVGGNSLEYEIVAEAPGWKVARAEVPLSKNFTVRMEVKGVLLNGKIGNAGRQSIPEDIIPPQITDEMMSWYKANNPTFGPKSEELDRYIKENGLNNLGSDFNDAFAKVFGVMDEKLRFKDGANTFQDVMNGFANCNGSNGFLSAVFDRDSSDAYVGVELNGIMMPNGGIHATSMVGKKDWTHLVETDAVKWQFSIPREEKLKPEFFSGTAAPMLIFQEGLGTDEKGGVTYRRPENGRVMRAPNPGGTMTAYDANGNVISNGALIGGVKIDFQERPITDFVALRRQLGIVAQATSSDAASVGGSTEIQQGGTTKQQGGGTSSWDFGTFSLPTLPGIGLQAK